MSGGLIQRGQRWTAVISLGYSEPDADGKRRPLQKWVALGKCTKREARQKREDLMVAHRHGEVVAPPKWTVGDWMATWLKESTATRRPNTVKAYTVAVNHLTAALGHVRLQSLRSGTLTRYFADRRAEGFAENTLAVHHSVISAALKSAARQGLVQKNVAVDVEAKPTAGRGSDQLHHWDADQCRTFMQTATQAGKQWETLFAFLLDSGARRAEALGLRWPDVDLDGSRVVIQQQLVSVGPPHTFGPPKAGGPRQIDLNDVTIRLLREHKRAQAERRWRTGSCIRTGISCSRWIGRHFSAPARNASGTRLASTCCNGKWTYWYRRPICPD